MSGVLNVCNNVFFAAAVAMVLLAVINYAVSVYNTRLTETGLEDDKLRNFKKGGFELNNKQYYIFLGIIAFVGLMLRIWKFGQIPGGFNQDGAMAAVDGKALADYATDRFGTHMPAHLYAWGYGQMSSLLSYMMVPWIKLFGLNAVTARMPQLIMSIAGGVFFYLFMRDIFGKKAGLIAAVFAAVNPWHLVQSRWALDCNLLPHFFMGGLYFLNKGLCTKKRYTYISMIFFGLCMYCYGITIYTIPVFLLACCIYYIVKKRIGVKEVLISAGIYLLIAWPFLLTMIINFMKWDTVRLPFVTIQYFSGSVRSSDILLFSDNIAQQIVSNVKSLLNTTLFQKKDLPWNDIEGFGTMFLCSMPFVFAGFIELYRTKTEGMKGLALFALFTGIWAGLMTNNVNVNRINIVYYGIMMFASLGIYFTIKELFFAKWVNIGIYAVMGTMLAGVYFTSYANEIKGQFYYGFKEAFETAQKAGTDKIFVTADAQGKGYWNVSEILTMFYDKTDAMYFQGKTNEEHGKQLLPYKERFRYESVTPEIVSETKNEDMAYVIMQSDSQYFNADEYIITTFGNFCSVVKR